MRWVHGQGVTLTLHWRLAASGTRRSSSLRDRLNNDEWKHTSERRHKSRDSTSTTSPRVVSGCVRRLSLLDPTTTPGTSNLSGRQPVESSYTRWACLQHPGRGPSGPGFQGLPTRPMSRSTGATPDHRSCGLWSHRPASRLVSGRSRQQGRRCDPSGRQSRSGAQSLRRRGQAAGPLRETRPPTTMPSVGREWGRRALCMPTVVPSRSLTFKSLKIKR